MTLLQKEIFLTEFFGCYARRHQGDLFIGVRPIERDPITGAMKSASGFDTHVVNLSDLARLLQESK